MNLIPYNLTCNHVLYIALSRLGFVFGNTAVAPCRAAQRHTHAVSLCAIYILWNWELYFPSHFNVNHHHRYHVNYIFQTQYCLCYWRIVFNANIQPWMSYVCFPFQRAEFNSSPVVFMCLPQGDQFFLNVVSLHIYVIVKRFKTIFLSTFPPKVFELTHSLGEETAKCSPPLECLGRVNHDTGLAPHVASKVNWWQIHF